MSGALKHPNRHPLVVLFHTRKLSRARGMNCLQEGPELFISDNCVWPEEVAPCDVDAVLERAGAMWAKSKLHPWSPESRADKKNIAQDSSLNRSGSQRLAMDRKRQRTEKREIRNPCFTPLANS